MRIDNPSISGSLSFIGGNNSISATSVNLTGSFSGSVVGTFEGAFSSTATANISGAFDSVSSSLASRIASQENFSSSLDSTFATDSDVTAVSNRVGTLEGKTLVSSSVQIASDISGSFTSLSSSLASELLKNTTDTLTGDLTVTGTITAQDLHVQEVTSSIVYSSGSNIFGSLTSDSQQVTGSLLVNGTGAGSVGTVNIKGSNAHLGFTSGSGTFRSWVGHFDSLGHGSEADLNIKTGYGTTGNIRFTADGDTTAAQMYLQGSSGRVGIGTTSPAGDLEISGSGASLRTITFNPGFNDDISISSMGVDGSGRNAFTIGQANSQNNSGVLRFIYNGAGSTSNYLGLGFYANDDKLVITPAGNVGIGTTAPGKPLHIDHSGDLSAAIQVGDVTTIGSNTGIYFRTTGNAYISTASTGTHIFDKAGTERMRIEADGKVGIGTTSPNHALDIYSNTNVPLRIHRPSNANLDSSGAWGIGFSTRGDAIKSQTDTRAGIFSAYNGDLFFAVNAGGRVDDDPDGNVAMWIEGANKYVGIGTTSPERNLHVFKGESGGATSNSDSSLVLENSSNTYLQFLTPTTTESGILFGDTDNDAGAITYNHNFNEFNFRTAGVSNRMTIDGSGNVGIGESNPASDLVVRSDSAGGRGGEISIVNYATNTVGNEAALNFGLENSTYNADSGNAQIKATVASATAATDMMFSTWNGSSFGERLRIESSGNMGFNTSVTTVGGSGTQTSTATPKRILFNNDYSNGYTDGSLKLYLFNLGATRHGFTSGPNYDLQYHSSGHSTQAAHTFYTNNNFVMRIGTGDTTNVGINTTNPVGLLNIHYTENDDNKRLRVSGDSSNYKDVQWKDTTSGEMWIWSHRVDALGNAFEAWYNNGTTWNSTSTLSLRPNGNIGIGTESASTKLHIRDNFDPDDNLGYVLIENTNTTANNAATNAAVNVKNYHGTSQFMQWENHGLRIGSRRLTNSGTGDVIFTAGADNERMRLLAGGGLTFNGDTAAANALDDYEEGSWSPVLEWSTGSSYTMSGITAGRYTKIGNQVFVSCQLQWNAFGGTTSGNLVVTGLPFTIGDGIRYAGSISALPSGISFSSSTYTQYTITGDPGYTYFYIIQQGSGTYSHQPTVASSGTAYSISLTYRIS